MKEHILYTHTVAVKELEENFRSISKVTFSQNIKDIVIEHNNFGLNGPFILFFDKNILEILVATVSLIRQSGKSFFEYLEPKF